MNIRLISIGALAALAALSANSQTAGGAAGPAISGVGGPAAAGRATTAITPVRPGTAIAPGIQPQPMPPGLQNGAAFPPGAPNTVVPQLGLPVPNEQLSTIPNHVPMRSDVNGQNPAIQPVLQDRAITPADLTLLSRVRQSIQLRVQGLNPEMPVHFDVQNGVVTLMGTVENPGIRQQLAATVQQIPGVVGVVDGLVVPGMGSVEQPAAISGPDQALLLRVRQVVLPQIQIGGGEVPVDFNVQQGVVTIIGAVPNIQQRHHIMALVRQVPGVLQVQDQMQINRAVSAPSFPNATAAGPVAPAIQNIAPAINPANPVPADDGAIQSGLTPTGRP